VPALINAAFTRRAHGQSLGTFKQVCSFGSREALDIQELPLVLNHHRFRHNHQYITMTIITPNPSHSGGSSFKSRPRIQLYWGSPCLSSFSSYTLYNSSFNDYPTTGCWL